MQVFDPNNVNVLDWLKQFNFFRTSTKLTENITETMLHYLDQRTRKLVEAGMGADNHEQHDTDRFELAQNQLKSLYQREEPSAYEFRDKFSARTQKLGESATLYVAELKRLAAKAYRNLTDADRDEYVRDRFINGLLHAALRNKLLFEPAASLNSTVETVRQWERVENKNKRAESLAAQSTPVHNHTSNSQATSLIYPMSIPTYAQSPQGHAGHQQLQQHSSHSPHQLAPPVHSPILQHHANPPAPQNRPF
jgi:hypothetical protein